MKYRLKRGESTPEGVRRMAAEQLGKALEHLACQDGKRDKHIHEARKATKRLRALVRLVRRELGAEVYALENLLGTAARFYPTSAGLLAGVAGGTVRWTLKGLTRLAI